MRTKLWLVLLVIVIVFMSFPVLAQCPMCKASVESSMKEGSTAAVGINRGILYLLSMPYLLFSVIFLLWYRHYRRHSNIPQHWP